MKKNRKFLYLFILIIFIIFLYSRQVCYPRFGDIFGISNLPIQTYGFFIAMAFLFGSIFLKDELERLYNEGKIKAVKKNNENKYEKIFNIIFSFFIGYQVVYIMMGNYQNFLKNPEIILSFHLNNPLSEIFIYFLGGLSLSLLNYFLSKKNTEPKKNYIKPHELIGTLLGVTLISGVLGAKLFYLFETEISWQNLVSFGGLTFYGGLICGTLGVIFYSKLNKISIPHIADAFAPILMLSYAIGRVGCQVSGDGCWGIPNESTNPNLIPEWLWSSQYINGTSSGTNMMDNNIFVWPTPIYETIMCLAIFGILWSIRKKIKIGGLLFSIYLILNGIERFFIEEIRVNESLIWFKNLTSIEITQGQLIAITLFLIGTSLAMYLLNKRENETI